MIENQMVIGEYYANWVEPTDEDIEEAAAETESRVRNGELRQEFLDFLFDTDFIDRTVGVMLSDAANDEAYLEIREMFAKHLTKFCEEE